jgi:hypothetical protein
LSIELLISLLQKPEKPNKVKSQLREKKVLQRLKLLQKKKRQQK